MSDLEATGWRLPDDACALLARLVEEHRPALIVECGSGRSTVVLAEAVAAYDGYVVALEHMPEYFMSSVWLLTESGLSHYGEVRLARLEPHGRAALAPDWYARTAWDDLHGIGMLVVDGPPGGSSRYARSPALPLLRNRLLPGCVVVLDDVNRESEQTIMNEWGIKMTLVEHAKATLGYGRIA
jgi:methyltransferase family protein